MQVMKQIISAALTPFTADNELDLDSAGRMYEFNIGHGIDGFFIFGTMGEWALTSSREKNLIAEHACEVIGKRAKIFFGIQDTGFKQMLENMKSLRHLPHDAWVMICPPGWAGPSNPVEYAHRLADFSDRPVYLYHNPSFNGINLEASQFSEILSHSRIKGIKNSADSIRIRKELLILRKSIDFELFEGQEWAVDESLMLGCDGAICGFGSCGSKILKSIAAGIDSGEFEKARKLQEKLIGMFKVVYGERRQHVWSGQKHALVRMGILSSPAARVDGCDARPEEIALINKCVDKNKDVLM